MSVVVVCDLPTLDDPGRKRSLLSDTEEYAAWKLFACVNDHWIAFPCLHVTYP